MKLSVHVPLLIYWHGYVQMASRGVCLLTQWPTRRLKCTQMTHGVNMLKHYCLLAYKNVTYDTCHKYPQKYLPLAYLNTKLSSHVHPSLCNNTLRNVTSLPLLYPQTLRNKCAHVRSPFLLSHFELIC